MTDTTIVVFAHYSLMLLVALAVVAVVAVIEGKEQE